jgi:type I restriction enzyme S subunit
MSPPKLVEYFDLVSEAPNAIPRLRSFIFDLAVRGKLVEQDPRDESASELLLRIQGEKERLVKTGEIKKQRPLSPIERAEAPFGVPPRWEWTRIRQVTSDRGQTTPDKTFTYIDVTAINKEVGCIADAKVLSPADAPSRARKLVRTGDVLYSCVRPYLLNVAVIQNEIVPAPIASTAFAVLNGFGLVLAQYLWIALRSPFMVRCVEGKMRGQAYPAINDSDFAELPFPLPPLAEQHRIVANVDELMSLCDRLEAKQQEREIRRDRLTAATNHRLNDAANAEHGQRHVNFYLHNLPRLTTRADQIKQLRQTILNLAMRGQLVLQDPGDEPASELLKSIAKQRRESLSGRGRHKVRASSDASHFPHLPKSWTQTKLETLTTKISDGEHFRPKVVEAGIPFLSAKDVREDGVFFDEALFVTPEDASRFRQRCNPEVGDILVVSRGATVGRCCMVETDRVFCLLGSVILLKLTPIVSKRFILWALKSPIALRLLIELSGSTAQQAIYLRDIRDLPIAIPPRMEQNRIVARVDELMAVCDRLETQLTAAQAEASRLLEAVLHQSLRQ